MELFWETKHDTIKKINTIRLKKKKTSDFEMRQYIKDNISYTSDSVTVYTDDCVNFLSHDNNIYDVIYIDPPYNTHQKFKTYNDDFSIPLSVFKKKLGNTKNKKLSNTQEMERLHENWLDMMYIVLSLLYDLLSNDGIFFCSLDDNEIYNAKLLCDEIFSPSSFVGSFSWIRTETPANLSKRIKKKIEYILCYTKTNPPKRFYGIEKKSKSSNGLMNQSNKEHILTFDKDKTIVNLKDGIYQKGTYGTKNYNIELLDDCIIENGKPKKDIVLYGKFKWSQKYLNDFITNEKGEIIIASEVFSPSYIKYGIQADTPTNLISKGDCGVGTSENATKALVELLGTNCFDYPKPTELIEYLSSFSGKTEQNILDVFAGSGTTGIATILHNKNTNSSWHSTLVEKNPENVEMIIKGCENVYSQHNKLHD